MLSPCPGAPAPDAGAEQYYSGNALYNRRLYTLAVQEYRAFLEKNPNHAKAEDARLALALSLYSAGKYTEAEPALGTVLRVGKAGDANQLKLLLAQCLQENGKIPEALKGYTEVAGAATGTFRTDALVALTDLTFRQKQWQDTARWSAALLEADPRNVWIETALYQGAYAHYQLKQPEDAARLLGRMPSPPRDAALAAQATLLLAEIRREAGGHAEAAEQYARLLKTADEAAAAELWFRLGYTQFQSGQYAEAIDAFRKSIARKPPEDIASDAALLLGRALLERSDFRGAADTLAPLAQKPGRNTAEAALWLSRCSSRQGKYAEAVTQLGPAVARFRGTPTYASLVFDYAAALMAESKFKDASTWLSEYLKLGGNTPSDDALRLHAVSLHRAGSHAESLQSADRFLAAKGTNLAAEAEVRFTRAEDLFFLERADDALKDYRAFLDACPTHASVPAARYRIVTLLHRKGACEEALREAEPLLKDLKRDTAFTQLDFMAGDCLFKLERWEEAIVRLGAFVDAHRDDRQRRERGQTGPEPNLDTALVELGLSHLRLQRADRAAGPLAELVQRCGQSPHLPIALAELGRLQYEAGDLRSARQNLEKVVSTFPNSRPRTQAEYGLAWTAQAEGKTDEAVKRFLDVTRAKDAGELAADAGLQAGLMLLGQAKYAEARGTLQTLLQANPNHPRRDLVVFSLAVALARQKVWNEAATHLRALIDSPSLPGELADRALYELAWCEKGLDRKPAAVACYRRLLDTHPESALAEKARTEMTELTFDAKEYDSVIAELRASLETLKDDRVREQSLYRLGTAYFGKNDLVGCATTFEALAAAYPKSPLRGSALFQAGECRMRLKETPAARDHFRAATGADDAKVRESAYLRLGETEGLLDRWRESGDAYGELLRLYPNSKWANRARFGLAWALERQGEYRRALAEYAKLVAAGGKDELSAKSQFQVGECLFALKEYDKAVLEFVRIPVTYRHEDWSAKATLEMGRALEAKGDRDKALAQFREVLQKYPNHDAAAVARERMDALRRE